MAHKRYSPLWLLPSIAIVVITVALFIGAIFIMFEAATNSGPGCPADPSWLGRCSEIDRQ